MQAARAFDAKTIELLGPEIAKLYVNFPQDVDGIDWGPEAGVFLRLRAALLRDLGLEDSRDKRIVSRVLKAAGPRPEPLYEEAAAEAKRAHDELQSDPLALGYSAVDEADEDADSDA